MEALHRRQGRPGRTHHLGAAQWAYAKDLLARRAATLAALAAAAAPSAAAPAPPAGERAPRAEEGRLWEGPGAWASAGTMDAFLATSEEIYNDAGAARSDFPGAWDTYRRREYHRRPAAAEAAEAAEAAGGVSEASPAWEVTVPVE